MPEPQRSKKSRSPKLHDKALPARALPDPTRQPTAARKPAKEVRPATVSELNGLVNRYGPKRTNYKEA